MYMSCQSAASRGVSCMPSPLQRPVYTTGGRAHWGCMRSGHVKKQASRSPPHQHVLQRYGVASGAVTCGVRRLPHRQPRSRTIAHVIADCPRHVEDEPQTTHRSALYLPFGQIDAHILSATAACAAAGLADPLMSLVDTYFVSKLGLVPLASLGPNAALFNVLFFLSFCALSVVTTERMTASNSAGDKLALGHAFIQSVASALGLGCLCAALLVAFPEQVLSLFQTNAEMMPHAVPYCVIRALAIPASLFMLTAQAGYRSLLDNRLPMLVVVAAGLMNGLLDPLLMFHFGMGIHGAAWATSLSQFFGAAVFCLLIWHQRHDFGIPQALAAARSGLLQEREAAAAAADGVIREPSTATCLLYSLTRLDWRSWAHSCVVLGLRAVLILCTWTLASMAAAHFGTGPMAGHQVIHQVLQLQLAVTWAFLSVGQSFVSNEFHAQYSSASASAKAALNMSNRICFWGIVVSIALGSCTWMMRQALPRLFLQEDGVLKLVAQSMHPACLMLGLAWNNVTEGCLLGIGDRAFVVGVYPWAVGVCVSLMLVMTLLNRGLPGIWWGLLMYYTGLVVPFACRLWIPRFRPQQLRTRLLPPAMLNPAA